ncbi:hypothetical protein ACFV0O_00340 [Kitasatospora sp. NPDC059577]|uniref:hypothetical protein n=1 Tax=Kitasatospora sp. NPDC059577 TaxID=3346873 RepID=UPI0036C8806C
MPSSDSNSEEFTAGLLAGAAHEHAGEVLREHGMLRLARLGRRDDVLLAADRLMSSLWNHRDADPDGLTVIRDTGRHDGRPGFAGLGHSALALHTEPESDHDGCCQHRPLGDEPTGQSTTPRSMIPPGPPRATPSAHALRCSHRCGGASAALLRLVAH